MKTIKIFLASSEELRQERELMASTANSLNTALEPLGIQVIMVEWENLDASMGINHKQDDYNEKLKECEMCLVLYWTKFGMYTKTELDTAYNEYKAGNNPRKLYVYFKSGSEPSEELKRFRDSFPSAYGHFFTSFENFDTLKAHFLLQFIQYQNHKLKNTNTIEVKNGKVVVGGAEYVNLQNVPFASNNEEYNLLLKSIKKTKKLLAITDEDDEEYADYAAELQEMSEKLSKMENSLWDTALFITRLSTTKCSERLQRAMDLFTAGDNKGAQAVLDEEEIARDINQNVRLMQIGNEARNALITNIEEVKLRIKTLENEQEEGWIEDVEKQYEYIVGIVEQNLDAEFAYDILNNWSLLLKNVRRYSKSIPLLQKMLKIGKDKNETYIRLGEAYCWTKDFDKSEEAYDLAMSIDPYDIDTKIKCLIGKANNYFATDLNKTKQLYSEAADLQKDRLDSPEQKLFYAQILNNWGNVYTKKREFAKAEEKHRLALKIRQDYSSVDQLESQNAVTYSLKNIGDMYYEQRKFNDAAKAYKEAIEIKESLAKDNSYIHSSHLSMCYNILGKIKTLTEDYSGAEDLLKKALRIRRTFAKYDRLAYINYVARTLDHLGELYTKTKKHEEANKLLQESLEIRKELYRDHAAAFEKELEDCILLINTNYKEWGKDDYLLCLEEIKSQTSAKK